MPRARTPRPYERDDRLIEQIRGTVCPACGAPKEQGRTFCRGCSERLPAGLRNRLRRQHGYAAAYAECLVHLGVPVQSWITDKPLQMML